MYQLHQKVKFIGMISRPNHSKKLFLRDNIVYYSIVVRNHIIRGLLNAWANQKWPKRWNWARNGRANDNGHIMSQSLFSELKIVGFDRIAIVTKPKMSQLGKCDIASLTGFALILAVGTDKVRYNLQQSKSNILGRYYIW